MTPRVFVPLSVVGFLLALAWLGPAPLTAQSGAASKSESAAKPWKVPRTPDGQPDLQGFWTNTTYVPLERPKNVTKEFYTKEEVAENIKRALDGELYFYSRIFGFELADPVEPVTIEGL